MEMIYCYILNGRVIGYGQVQGWSSNPDEIVMPIEESSLIELLGENWREQYTRLGLVDGELVVMEELESEEGTEE